MKSFKSEYRVWLHGYFQNILVYYVLFNFKKRFLANNDQFGLSVIQLKRSYWNHDPHCLKKEELQKILFRSFDKQITRHRLLSMFPYQRCQYFFFVALRFLSDIILHENSLFSTILVLSLSSHRPNFCKRFICEKEKSPSESF